MALSHEEAKRIIESVLFYSREPISIKALEDVFIEEDQVSTNTIKDSIAVLMEEYCQRGVELIEVASGYRFQVCADLSPWITRLMAEKPARYSRALLETLALIAYKQPITRGEIEEVRGVAVSTNIIRTLEEREWIKVIGHRDVPGKPALFATTKTFLDDMNLTSLGDLPTLAEIQDLDDGQLTEQLKFALNDASSAESESVQDAGDVLVAEEVPEVEQEQEYEKEYEQEIALETEAEAEVEAEIKPEVVELHIEDDETAAVLEEKINGE